MLIAFNHEDKELTQDLKKDTPASHDAIRRPHSRVDKNDTSRARLYREDLKFGGSSDWYSFNSTQWIRMLTLTIEKI